MKILNTQEYINEKLNIKPIGKNDKRIEKPMVDDETKSFIDQYELVWNKNSRLYDCNIDITIDYRVVDKDGKLKIKFGIIKGVFDCSEVGLTSLEGAPQKVNGIFRCTGNQLTSLKGAPQEVYSFWCGDNKLTSLEGAPQKVDGDFGCNRNILTSLKGSPRKINGYFYCNNNQLTSLEGAPQEVGRDFWCKNNPNLKLSKEKTSWVKGNIIK